MRVSIVPGMEGVGVTQDGEWVERAPDGKWVPCDTPPDMPAAPAPVTMMVDPYNREETAVEMVNVRRVLRRTVPDYEAEVLIRNGWELDT